MRRIEARAQELYTQMFTSLYTNPNIKINKNELSKQVISFISDFYKPLLMQINPYNLGRKKRHLETGEQYAYAIVSAFNPNLSSDVSKFRLLVDVLVNRFPDHSFAIDCNLLTGFIPNIIKLNSIEGMEIYSSILNEFALLYATSTSPESIIEIVNKPNLENQSTINVPNITQGQVDEPQKEKKGTKV